MRLELTDGTNLEIDEDVGEEELATALADTSLVAEIVKKLGENSWFSTFSHDNDMDDTTSRTIVQAYLEDGRDGVYDLFDRENWLNDPRDHLDKDDVKRALRPLVDKVIGQVDWLDEDELAECLFSELEESILEAMSDADKSTLEDAVPPHTKVELTFVPDLNVLAFDDMYTQHYDVVFSAETAIPDANLMRVFKFLNIAPSEFVAAAKELGIDLINPEIGDHVSEYRKSQIEENALRWRAVLDVENGTNENISKLPLRSKYEIADWNNTVDLVKTAKDHDRPAAVSMDDLFTILDNATSGGVPVYVARYSLRDILAGKLEKPFMATRGGFVGIHDFINGSGYIEKPCGPVLIDPSKGELRAKIGRWSVDDVYGIVGSYYDADIEPFEVPDFQRVGKNKWLHVSEDGRQAEIHLGKGGDGADEYWLSTMNKDGDLDGPYSTSEVFSEFEDAKDSARKVLTEEWTQAPAP